MLEMYLLDISICLLETSVPSYRRLQRRLGGIANQAAARGHLAYRRSHLTHPLILQTQTYHSASVYANLEPQSLSRFTSSSLLTRNLFNLLLVAHPIFKVKMLPHRRLDSHLVLRNYLDRLLFVRQPGRRVSGH